MAHNHEKITYGMEDVKELFDAGVLTGTIVEVDTDNDKAHVNISGFGQINDVPIFYHCEGESTTEGGSIVFLEGDNVYVLNKEGRASPSASDLQIVGFVNGLKSCGCYFKEHWGAILCANHDDWKFRDALECELPEDIHLPLWTRVITLSDGILAISLTGNFSSDLCKGESFVSQAADFVPKEIKIKISANAQGTTDPYSYAYILLEIGFSEAGIKTFILAINPAMKPGDWPPEDFAYIGDNGGEEQTIVISDYFTIPEDDRMISFCMHCGSQVSASYNWDYIEIQGKCIPWE